MKGMMAFGFFMLFLAAMALVNVGKMSPDAKPELQSPSTDVLQGERWRLVALRGTPGAAAGAIELQFTRGGMVTGNGLCQFISGRYEYEQGVLAFSGLAVSTSTCNPQQPHVEQALLAQLATAVTLSFDGRNLVALSADSTRLARFVPTQPEAP